jgi:hypothetical protein
LPPGRLVARRISGRNRNDQKPIPLVALERADVETEAEVVGRTGRGDLAHHVVAWGEERRQPLVVDGVRDLDDGHPAASGEGEPVRVTGTLSHSRRDRSQPCGNRRDPHVVQQGCPSPD